VITLLGLIILVCTIAVVEVDDFALVSPLLGLQGLLLAIHLALEGAGMEVVPLALFSVLLVPVSLYYVTSKTKRSEESPLIGGLPSTGLLAVLVAVAYVLSLPFFGADNIMVPLLLISAYGLLAKTDLRKSVATLSLLVSSIHLSSSLDIVVEAAMLGLSALLLLSLLYFTLRIFAVKGSMTTRDLKELKF